MSGSSSGKSSSANESTLTTAGDFVLRSESASAILKFPSAFLRAILTVASVPGSRCPAKRERIFREPVARALTFPKSQVKTEYSESLSPIGSFLSTTPQLNCSVITLIIIKF